MEWVEERRVSREGGGVGSKAVDAEQNELQSYKGRWQEGDGLLREQTT